MKRYHLPHFLILVCFLGVFFSPFKSYGQLTGNYTINPTLPASSSNYQNWASAINDLSGSSRTDGGTSQGPGVGAAVVFTVYDTVFANTSVTIPAITGASSANTITFKSRKGDSSKCVLQYASGTSSSDDWVLNLNGADYITFSKIGFERTGVAAYGTVVQIGNTARHNNFLNCLMKGQKIPSSLSKGFQTGIGSCINYLGSGDSSNFIQNRFLYGYNSIYNVQTGSKNYYAKNICDTPGSAGIYMNNQSQLKIVGNTLNMGDFGPGKGHYTCYALRVDFCTGFEVSGNKAVVTAVNAQVCRSFVFANDPSTAGAPAMVYNNSIYNSGGTGNCNGIALNTCSYINVFYNNVLINNSLADAAAMFLYISTTNSKMNLLNNNFINKGTGYALSAGDANSSGFDTIDNNNLYSAGAYPVLWSSTSGKYSLSGFQTASGKCAKCLSLDPGFISSTDLHVSNIAINGKALPVTSIATDIDGDTRDATKPDIGSDEFFPIANDAGVVALDSPSFFCSGKRVVKVKFQNFGSDTLKSLNIGWSVNGTAQTGASWSGSVAPGASSASISLGLYSFADNTPYNFKIWTTKPNGATDGKTINDTLRQMKLAAMTGTYTIDASSGNYKTFNTAITAMAERGVCGPVTFNVSDGTYNEQLGITQIPGMGSSSPITFQSLNNDSSLVIVQLLAAANSGSNNAVVQLRGANYVTFKGLTFLRYGGSPSNIYAQVVHVMNGSHHNTFANCQLIGLQLTAANATANNIWSDQSNDDYNTFKNNYIKWGNVSMQYAGTSAGSHETGTVIENNIFEGAYNNSVHVLYNDRVTVRGNTFKGVVLRAAANYDLMVRDCDSNINISSNRFLNSANVRTSISINACAASAAKPGLIANNFIISADTATGIRLDTTANMSVVFNSINFTGTGPSSSAIRTTGYSTNSVISNNNIVMSTGEALHVTSGSEVSASDNNNLLAKGAQFVYWGSSYASLSALATATSKNVLSKSVNPMFASASDLHIINPLLKGAGVPVAGVTTDIDGDTRNATTPDIGADEFKLYPHDAGITGLTSPVSSTCIGTLPVKAIIKNYGGDTLKSAGIQWSVYGSAQTPYSWSGSLATNQSDTVTLGNFTFAGLNPQFIIKAIMPNGNTDGIVFNDSIIVTRNLLALPSANAGADDTICKGQQIDVGPTNNLSYKYKWREAGTGIVVDSFARITVSPSVTTTYALEVINKSTGCAKSDTMTIRVNDLPSADAGADKIICVNAGVKIGTAAQSGYAYSWSSDPSGFTSAAAEPVVAPTTSTSYALEVTETATGCTNTDTMQVTTVALPTPVTVGPDAICEGGKANYSTTDNSGSGNTYLWYITGGQILSGQNTSAVTVLWNTTGTGAIGVRETNTTGCKDSMAIGVTVAGNPAAGFTADAVCKGSATPFVNHSTSGTDNDWTFGDGGNSTSVNPSYTYANAGNYNVRLIVKNASGCADTATRQVTVNAMPVSDFNLNKTGQREYDFTDASTISSGSITAWKWHFGDGDSAATQSPNHQYANEGTYDITLCVTSAAGCTACTVKTQNVLGIFNPSVANTLFAAPNPGTGLFRITSLSDMDAVTVSNMLGQTVAVIKPADKTFSIDLTSQPDGVYFIKAESGNSSSMLKLIKQ